MIVRAMAAIAASMSLNMCATERVVDEGPPPPDAVGPDGLELMTAPSSDVDAAPLPDAGADVGAEQGAEAEPEEAGEG